MRKRNIVRTLTWLAAALFLSAGWGNGCTPDTMFRGKPPLTADADTLKKSYVSAVLDTTIQTGTNVLWCSTFQLAWDQACKTVGGDLRFQPPEDPMVAALNHHVVSPADLDSDSFIAMAGRVGDGIIERINLATALKFPGAPRPRFAPRVGLQRPQDIEAYSYLFKKLDFPVPFERLDEPLNFGGTNVTAFGMGFNKPGHEKMAGNVSILDYKSADDFVIELKTKSALDHLVLAKVKPEKTLGDTIAMVQKRRENASPIAAYPSDVMSVPKMFFDITRGYHEIVGRTLIDPATGTPTDQQLLEAVQNIKFQIDEKGVVLVSEANMSFGCSAEGIRMPVHQLIFDKPFLLVMSREGGKSPYFALWVDNAELLEKAGQQ